MERSISTRCRRCASPSNATASRIIPPVCRYVHLAAPAIDFSATDPEVGSSTTNASLVMHTTLHACIRKKKRMISPTDRTHHAFCHTRSTPKNKKKSRRLHTQTHITDDRCCDEGMSGRGGPHSPVSYHAISPVHYRVGVRRRWVSVGTDRWDVRVDQSLAPFRRRRSVLDAPSRDSSRHVSTPLWSRTVRMQRAPRHATHRSAPGVNESWITTTR